jgi:hypothetical protein
MKKNRGDFYKKKEAQDFHPEPPFFAAALAAQVPLK